MSACGRVVEILILIGAAVCLSPAQVLQGRETYRTLTNPQTVSGKLPAPQDLRNHIDDGKLVLSLEDAVVLTLENNTGIRLQELQVENAKYSLLRSHQAFDPFAAASFSALREISPSYTQLAGASTLSALTQQSALSYYQMFETGTNILASFNATRLSSNSTFDFFNPSISSGLSLQFTQPLLRNRGLFVNRAPIVIARRNLQQSKANFESQVNDTILQAATQYWNVVEASGTLEVERRSLEEAEASYKHDKRALELGALPPLDIYRSESEVASRRVAVIQGEYFLKQQEDILRRTIGADQDSYYQVLDLVLTEKPEPGSEMLTIDTATALQQAAGRRPEFELLRQALANDATGIRVAHNQLLPDLSLTGSYSSNGLGGNELDTATGQVISSGGFGNSLNQLFGFGFPSYGVTLSLNLPIKNRAAQANLGNAMVSRQRDLYSERQFHESVTLEVSNAVHQLEQAKLTVAAANVALDLSKKTLAAEQRKYELGSESIFFVLNAQTQLAGAEADLLQAQVSYQLSLAAVDHATGGLLARYNVKITELTR
jgi:outer membrane protein